MASLIERYSDIFSPFIKESYRSDEAIFRTTFTKVWFAIFAVAVVLAPTFLGEFRIYFLSTLGVAILSCMGLNILTGYTGLISLGHAAFMGVGAYTCGVLINQYHWPFYVAILGAGGISAFIGVFIGVPALRIKGLYLAIVTLAFQFIANYIFLKWVSITGGSSGINIPTPRLGSWVLGSYTHFYYIIVFYVVLGLWVANNLFRSKYGRALMAIRDNDVSAEVNGIPVFRYKVFSFVISAFYAGMAGALYGIMMRMAAPDEFGLSVSIKYLAMVIVGGMGTILGSIFGAVFLVVIPELLNWSVSCLSRFFTDPNAIVILISPVKMMMLGFLIIFFIHVEPTGLAGIWRRIRDYFKIWPLPYT